eukprot:scaffold16348_cov55-Cyclotella_meneghiniana.AAC.1
MKEFWFQASSFLTEIVHVGTDSSTSHQLDPSNVSSVASSFLTEIVHVGTDSSSSHKLDPSNVSSVV